MQMDVSEIIGLFTAIVVLAGLSVVIVNGGKTASVLQATTTGFSNMITAATKG